jgi:hypothetical protein
VVILARSPGFRLSMFSVFPASTPDRHQNGFARPVPRSQGKQLNRGLRLAEVKTGWEAVARQVRDQGLLLGVHAEHPR